MEAWLHAQAAAGGSTPQVLIQKVTPVAERVKAQDTGPVLHNLSSEMAALEGECLALQNAAALENAAGVLLACQGVYSLGHRARAILLCNKASEASDAIATHLRLAPIRIEDPHRVVNTILWWECKDDLRGRNVTLLACPIQAHCLFS